MSNDSRYVLAQLTKSGLWSNWANLLNYKHLVVDADSVLTHLYQYCQARHLARQRNLAAALKLPRHLVPDYYSATLVNYQELSRLIERVFGCLEQQFNLQPVVVYRGKHMEAPLFGLGPAQLKKNTQRASEALIALVELEAAEAARETADRELEAHQQTQQNPHQSRRRNQQLKQRHDKLEATLSRLRPSRPNLALNLFKQAVSKRLGGNAPRANKQKVQLQHQAFYCPYPTLARLARDLKCPVLTNDGDFIIMDVRAGFILFDNFFQDVILGNGNSVLRHPSNSSSLNLNASMKSLAAPTSPGQRAPTSASSVSSMARNQLVGVGQRATSSHGSQRKSPSRSPAMDVESTKSLFKQPRSPKSATQQRRQVSARFHYHRLFLRQHPGLNPSLALQLFPLTSGEFLLNYSKSLIRFHIYDREFQEKDLMMATSEQHSFKKFHMAAARLETVLRFLCTKNSDILAGLMRGEAARLHAPLIESDYNELYNYYAVSYHFKGRLKLILKGAQLADLMQLLLHLESSLIVRECSADFWLSLFVCALGRMAAVDYNKTLQFEDLKTKHSGHSMLDRSKTLMMSLMSDNKQHKSEHSPALSDKQRQSLEAKYPTASLTVIDRVGRQLVERSLGTNKFPNAPASLQEELRSKLALLLNPKVAKAPSSSSSSSAVSGVVVDMRREACSLINLAFNSHDMTKLQFSKLEQQLAKWHLQQNGANNERAQQNSSTRQLAVLLTLHKFSIEQAMQDDQYFKQNYLGLSHHFEIGLVNHHLYLVYLASSANSQQEANSTIERDLKQLVDLVHRHDLENVANLSFPLSKEQREAQLQQRTRVVVAKSLKNTIATKKSQPSSQQVAKNQLRESAMRQTTGELRRRIRHLLELLACSLEAYCELNAFFNYPMPQLQLGQCFNPILLYNLTLFSCEQPINTQLVKF